MRKLRAAGWWHVVKVQNCLIILLYVHIILQLAAQLPQHHWEPLTFTTINTVPSANLYSSNSTHMQLLPSCVPLATLCVLAALCALNSQLHWRICPLAARFTGAESAS